MDNSDEIELVSDNPQGQSVEQESEEIRKLKQQLSDVYQAWVSGRPPPQGPSEGTYTIPHATQPPIHAMSDPILPPRYMPNYSLYVAPSTSNMQPPVASVRNTPLVVSGALVYTIPPPPPVMRPNNEPPSHAYDGQYYSPNMAFGVSAPYNQTPRYESSVENEMPATTIEPDEMARKMKSLEQNIKNIQGLGGHKSVSFSDLCMFPHIHLPRGFKTPKFEKYDGHGNPIAHLKRYCNQLRGAGGKEELLMAYFGESLVGKKPTESFREYAIKWREQTARVKPPMDNYELITVFLEAQEPDYFQNMMSAMGRPFAEAIKIGEMVENGLKTGRIVSQVALKATTQAIQNGSGSFANRKKRDEGSMMTSGFREVQRGASHPYVQVHQGRSSYPRHYYPPPIPQYSVGPPQYTVFNAQSYARPPNQQKLKKMGVIGPIAPHHMHPNSHGFQANARCEYHSGAPGNSTDDRWTLKGAIERLISKKLIVVTNGEDPPNVTNNPLPEHNDVHFVGMIG
ncbi:uncharacterized protein [Nicotiana sylvestris]|uniref:uncharacterized protein n=1 Tax=Nicotiana sylvestris TaxID=4096 RepID=UPI00388C96CE